MTKHQAKDYLDRFMNPSGLLLVLSAVMLSVNAYTSLQLFPLIRNIDSLNQRVSTLETQFNSTTLVIIPKGELDAKFDGINNQLADIKEQIRNK